LEVVLGIVRAGRGFRMVLDRDYRQSLVAHAFNASVVEIDVRYLDVARKAVSGNRESMIV
jgi:hypothetical protein